MNTILIAKLSEDATIPTKKYNDDAGYDVYSSVDVEIGKNQVRVVNTGITFSFPKVLRMRVVPRGRHNHLIGAGLIESNYQGELLVKIVNTTGEPLHIRKGDSIAQVIFEQNPETHLVEIDRNLIHTALSERGTSGGIVTQTSTVTVVDNVEKGLDEWLAES